VTSPRIIAGSAKGYRLKDVPGDTTRPITDRVKEALFSILAADIPESTWLDLFAGTGSVGIEALSRSANFVRFVDIHRQAVETVQYNLAHTRFTEKAQVVRADAFSILRQPPDRSFEYIYIAPPQYKDLWIRALQALDQNPGWLSPDGWIIVQIDPIEYQDHTYLSFNEFEKRRYGNTMLLFYEHRGQPIQE